MLFRGERCIDYQGKLVGKRQFLNQKNLIEIIKNHVVEV